MKIGFIGGGNMGEAMLAALLSKKLAKAADVAVADVSESRRQYLAQKYMIKTFNNNLQTISSRDVIVLSIKPQVLAGVLNELNGQLKPEQLVLSIIAGAKIDTLRQGLNHKSIVRSMPNTPAQIGEGVTVWTATETVDEAQKKLAGSVLGAMGKEFYVSDEGFLDMATAISGSGPAYIFYFVEAMIDSAMKIGFSPEMAKELVMGTTLGAVHLMQKSGKEPAELRRMVTSPGGTTAAAIGKFEEGGFTTLVNQAVKAALERAKQLGTQK